MWTEESRKMWGCAWNRHWRDPQASPNSNWRKHSLQSLPWTIRPWIHANRSQDYWFHRPCIILMKQSLKLRTYLMFNIWTHTFNRTPKYSFNKLNKNFSSTCSENSRIYLNLVTSPKKLKKQAQMAFIPQSNYVSMFDAIFTITSYISIVHCHLCPAHYIFC